MEKKIISTKIQEEDIKNEKRKKFQDYTLFLSGAKSSDICSIFVLSIYKNRVFESFYDE